MNIIQKLNLQIDKKNEDYDSLITENILLKAQLDSIKNKNDQLIRTNEDMLLSIDKTLSLTNNLEQELDISVIRESIER